MLFITVSNTAHDSIAFYYCSFLDDIEVMLKWRPPVVYKYLWKYVCLLAMVGLLAASLLRMVFKPPTYTAWNQTAVRYCPFREMCLGKAVLSFFRHYSCPNNSRHQR